MNGKKRDPQRIKRIMYLLQEVWESNPDIRFFQFVDSIQNDYSFRNNGFGKRTGFELDSKGNRTSIAFIDLFYLEDNEFETFLQDYVKQFGDRK